MQFNIQEIDLLLQGLEAIEKQESMSDTMGDILATVLAKDDAQREKMMLSFEWERAKNEEKRRMRRMLARALAGKLANMQLAILEENPFIQAEIN